MFRREPQEKVFNGLLELEWNIQDEEVYDGLGSFHVFQTSVSVQCSTIFPCADIFAQSRAR